MTSFSQAGSSLSICLKEVSCFLGYPSTPLHGPAKLFFNRQGKPEIRDQLEQCPDLAHTCAHFQAWWAGDMCLPLFDTCVQGQGDHKAMLTEAKTIWVQQMAAMLQNWLPPHLD